MPHRTLTNDTLLIDPQLLPTKHRRPPTLVSAITSTETTRRHRQQRLATATETLHALTTPTASLLSSSSSAPAQMVFMPNDGAAEKTSALDRAQATVYRMHPLTLILAILATGLALWLHLGLGLALCLFAVTAVAGYASFNVTDYRYSRAGLERHRITMATQVEYARLGHEKALKALALASLIQLHDIRPIAYEPTERNRPDAC